MPRIRTIKPDAFKSDSLSELSILARWTFAGLWTYVDDYGKARDDARLIKAELFPIDDKTSLADVKRVLVELEESGSICRYTASGKQFLHCPKWGDHQRVSHPTASKIPDCPKDHLTCTLEDSGAAPEPLASPPESLRPERKGKEQGKGSGTSQSRGSDRFDDFWSAYPRKNDKGNAIKAWAKALKAGADAQAIIDGAEGLANRVKNADPKFTPYPATWLNGQRWLDEEPTPGLRPDSEGRFILPPLPKGVFEQ